MSDHDEHIKYIVALMCSKGGQDLVEKEILNPFGYSLNPKPYIRKLNNLQDAVERFLSYEYVGEIDYGSPAYYLQQHLKASNDRR